MASRGMGDVNLSKMPKAKKIVRKDNPNAVSYTHLTLPTNREV